MSSSPIEPDPSSTQTFGVADVVDSVDSLVVGLSQQDARGEAALKPPGSSFTGMTTRTVSRSPAPSEPAAIRTDGLTRTFGSFTAVDGLDLEIPAGIAQ